MLPVRLGDSAGFIERGRQRQFRLADEETGQSRRAVANDGHAKRLEPLQGGSLIEDAFGACANGDHRVPREGGEVRGFVVGLPVDAADPAGREDPQTGAGGGVKGGCDGGTGAGALSHECAKVPERGFLYPSPRSMTSEPLELRHARAHDDLPVQDRHGGRDGTLLADRRLEIGRGLEVLGMGQPVGDDGGLESYHRFGSGEGVLDVGGDAQTHDGNDIARAVTAERLPAATVLDSVAVEVPDLSTVAPYLQQLTFGAVAGFLVGYSLKKVGKFVAIIVGLLFVAVQTLAYFGFLTVNWGQVQGTVDPLLEPDSINDMWRGLVSLLTYNITFAVAFVPALVIGLKRG